MIIMFGRKNCKSCIEKKKEFKDNGIEFEYYDIDTNEGLAKAAFKGLVDQARLLPIIIKEE